MGSLVDGKRGRRHKTAEKGGRETGWSSVHGSALNCTDRANSLSVEAQTPIRQAFGMG